MVPRGIPDGLDADTTRRIVRSLLVVRIVRGGLLLLFLAIAFVAVEVKDWPGGVSVAIAIAMLVQAGALAGWYRRYVRAGSALRHPPGL
jgi:uncharacterized membrane protein